MIGLRLERAASTIHEQPRRSTSSLDDPRAASTIHEQPLRSTSSLSDPRAASTIHEQPRAASSSLDDPRAASTIHEQPQRFPRFPPSSYHFEKIANLPIDIMTTH
jgi:hypothetical protein